MEFIAVSYLKRYFTVIETASPKPQYLTCSSIRFDFLRGKQCRANFSQVSHKISNESKLARVKSPSYKSYLVLRRF